VQRCALETNNRDPLLAAARVDLIQQFLDSTMTGSHVPLLAREKVSPLRWSLPAERAREQRRYTVNHRNGAGQPPLDRGPVGCDQGGLGKLARQPFGDFAQSPLKWLAKGEVRALVHVASYAVTCADNLSSEAVSAAKKNPREYPICGIWLGPVANLWACARHGMDFLLSKCLNRWLQPFDLVKLATP